MHHLARAVLIGLSAVAAALATSSVTALAFDRVESLQPIPAGHSYVYYVKELDTDRLPIQGRTVTVTVSHDAGRVSRVAQAYASGHPTGPAGPSATEVSGADGLAFFILKTSSTPGDNEWVWKDDTYTGQVIVVGKPLGPGTTTSPTHNSGTSTPVRHPRVPAGRAALPPTAIPPLAAGIFAAMLTWLLATPPLRRYIRGLELPVAMGDGLGLPQTSRP